MTPRASKPSHRICPRGCLRSLKCPSTSTLVACSLRWPATNSRQRYELGGMTPELYPQVGDVAAFIVHAAAAGVPFKATAGMHHPLPNDNPDVPARQLGFLNVFLAAALAHHAGLDAAAVQAVLETSDPDAFEFDGAMVHVAGHALTAVQLEESRLSFCLSFGSCSLEEPWNDLHALGLLVQPSTEPIEEFEA